MKIKFTITLLVLCLSGISQTHWTLNPLEVTASDNAKLGTSNNRSVRFVSNDTTRLIMDSIGRLILPKMSGDGSRLLMVDENGNMGPADAPVGGYSSSVPCVTNAKPWYEGGNTVQGGPGNNNNIIGPCNQMDFILQAYNTPLVFIKYSGFVGIGPGNSSPSAQLDITDGQGDHLLLGGDVTGEIKSTTDMNLFFTNNFYVHQGGGSANPHLSIKSGGNVGIGTTSPGTMKLSVVSGSGDGIQNKISSNTAKAISVYNTVSTKTPFIVYGNGKTVIGDPLGTNNIHASSFMLSVKGKIVAQEVIVTIQDWPDYVFDENYQLQSLKEVEKFYLVNKHLKNIPSVKEAALNGIELAEMNKLLLEKIEELTLYLVQQDKKIEKIENRIREFEQKN